MSTESAAGRRRIVVGVDGSEQSKLALRWAASIAGVTGGSLEPVVAWRFPASYGWGYVGYTEDDWNPETDAKKYLNEAVDSVFGDARPPNLRLVVREGDPAKVLLEESNGATMLVLGSRGHGGFTGLLLGSVSAKCAEHATCPVLVVHGTEPPAAMAPEATKPERVS